MKKIFSFFAAALFILNMVIAPASAEKTEWVDKDYNFKLAKKVIVYDLSIVDKTALPNDIMADLLKEDYMKNAQRPKFEIVRPTAPPNIGHPVEGADLYVIGELLDWHDDSYVRPGYTTWENKTMTRTYRHHDGSTYEDKYTVTVPVNHPPRTIYTSTVRVRFGVFDAKTGKRVMARDELRLRDDSRNGERGIFGRITKSFFDDFGKKLRRD